MAGLAMNRRESWQDWHNRALRAMCLMNFDLTRLAIVAVAAHSVLSGMGYDYYAPPPTEDSE